jgi:alpha-amylase
MLTSIVDGLRIDSAQQVDQAFWKPFLSAAGNNIYAVGEVFNGDPNYLCPYQQYLPGLMNYPAYVVLRFAL